jgi:hypothetical protein
MTLCIGAVGVLVVLLVIAVLGIINRELGNVPDE